MDIVDGIIIGVIVLSGLLGLSRGLIKEILNIAALVFAIVLALITFPYVSELSQRYIYNAMLADIAAGSVLFIVFYVLLRTLNHLFFSNLKKTSLGFVDKSLGLVFGVARGLLVLCGFHIILHCFLSLHQYPSILRDNRLMPTIIQSSDTLLRHAPQWVRGFIRQQQQRFKVDADEHVSDSPHDPTIMEDGESLQDSVSSFSQSLAGGRQDVAEDNPETDDGIRDGDHVSSSLMGNRHPALAQDPNGDDEAERIAHLKPRQSSTVGAGRVNPQPEKELNHLFQSTEDEAGPEPTDSRDAVIDVY